jgi:outer membrane protein assembly factor BamD (BamD/ComL family)
LKSLGGLVLKAKEGFKRYYYLISGAALTITPAFAGVDFHSFQTHSHLVIPADPAVTYSVERLESGGKLAGLRVVLENYGGEADAPQNAADVRTERILFRKGPKVIYEVHFSDKAKAAGVEYFDYRNKSTSEISIDYWLKSQQLQPEEPKPAPKKAAAPRKKKVLAKAVPKETPRSPGCGQPLKQEIDPFTRWKTYHRAYAYRSFFNLMPADVNYKYPEPAGKGKDVGHYKLALKLYREQKYALTLRTIDFFDAQYPKSPLKEELDFLRASTLVQLSRLLRTDRYLDQALDMYRTLVLADVASEKGKLALAFIVQELMGHGHPVFALEYALIGADQKSDDAKDITSSVYRLASAEALSALGEHDRAERAYQLLMDKANAMSPEASFRIGETYAARKLWERAASAYETAIKQYPNEAGRFPTTWFNLAETYFRLERYTDAERVYKEFATRFVNDDAAWAAQLRLAELEQIKLKAPDPSKHDGLHDLYEGIVNRYPYSPGAMMAELRLARCFRPGTDADRTRQFFVNLFANRELKKFESALVDPVEAETWMDLAEARFFELTGDYRASLGRADDYRSKLAKIALGDSFREVFAKAVVGLAQSLAAKGSHKELLAAVEHYGDLAPKPEPIAYALAIANARLGEGDMKGSAEKLASIESRLKDATEAQRDAYHLARVREMKLLGEKPDRILAELGTIRDDGELAALKYDELARTESEKGDYKAALAYDEHLLEGPLVARLTPELLLGAHVRRAENTARHGSAEAGARLAEHALLKYGTFTQFPALLGRAREIRAQGLYDSGKFQAAVEAIDEILSLTPDHPRRSEFQYMRGKSLARLGRESEAADTFRRLAQASTDDVWKKSAQAELQQLQWETKTLNQIKTGGLNQ